MKRFRAFQHSHKTARNSQKLSLSRDASLGPSRRQATEIYVPKGTRQFYSLAISRCKWALEDSIYI